MAQILTNMQCLGIGIAAGFLLALVSIAFTVCIARPILQRCVDNWTRARYSSLAVEPTVYERIVPPEGPDYSTCVTVPERLAPMTVSTLRMNLLCNLGIHNSAHVLTMMTGPGHEESFDEAELTALAGAPPEWLESWSSGFADWSTRPEALQRFLAQTIVPRMHPSGNLDETLLPVDILRPYQHLLKNTLLQGKSLNRHTAVWRETTYLMMAECYGLPAHDPDGSLGSMRGHPTPGQRDERRDQLRERILKALRFDLPLIWASDQNPTIYLNKVLMKASNVAFALFGQSHDWEAVWESDVPGHLCFPEVRLTWQGEVTFTVPALVEMVYYEGGMRHFWDERSRPFYLESKPRDVIYNFHRAKPTFEDTVGMTY